MQNSLRERLQEDGYGVLSATTVDQGIDVLKANSVNLILLDLRLGEKSGLDFLDEMSDDAMLDKKDTPVTILSSIADPAMAMEVVARGQHDYLVKTDNSMNDIVAHIRQKLPPD